MSAFTPDRRAASRLLHASRLWQRYLEADRLPQLDRWLAQELKQQRQFGKQDRHAYSEILFAAVRFGYLAAFLDFARGRLDLDSREGLAPFLTASLDAFSRVFAEPDAAVKALRHMPPEVLFYLVGRRYDAVPGTDRWPLTDAAEVPARRQLDRLFDALARLCADGGPLAARLVWAGIPLAYEPALRERERRAGWDAAALGRFLDAQASRPPLWLRLNRPEQLPDALDALRAAQLKAVEEDGALRVEGDRSLYESKAYEEGLVEIQDWASQRIGAAVDAKPGELVWDACAGGGGKTIQIAAALRNRGAVYASDIREYKLKEVRRRAARAHFDNVRAFVWQGEPLTELPREVARVGGFHWVLVDAPCSSTGTWRRNPDARFRVSEAAIAELTALQSRLISAAASAVRPGGHLVYSTCSWRVDENEAVVERFLARHPEFHLVEQALVGSPARDADTMFRAVLSCGAAA